MTIAREEVNDPIERLVGIVSVERAKTQMAGLGKSNGMIHRLACTYLTDHDHIGRLAQSVLQRDLKTFRVHPHFALRDDAAPMLMDELDGILDTDDMPGGIFIVEDGTRIQGRALGGNTMLFNNAGQVIKADDSGSATLEVDFENLGEIEAQTGLLNFTLSFLLPLDLDLPTSGWGCTVHQFANRGVWGGFPPWARSEALVAS